MSSSVIHALLNPGSVAIVGASDDVSKWGGSILGLLRKFGYPGSVYPINPKGGMIQGLQSYPSIRAVGHPVDVAVLAVPQERTLAALQDCAQGGVRAVLLLTSQFAESGPEGQRLQDQLTEAAHAAGIRIIGPNCMGYFNSHARLSLLNAQALMRHDTLIPGHTALISQSGALAGAMLAKAYDLGMGMSFCVSLGNQADLEACDFLEYAIADPNSHQILLYVEGVKSPERFVAGLHAARAAGKPVLMVKAGRTEVGTRAVQSHTASMAGAFQAFEATVRHAGVVLVDNFIELITWAAAWERLPAPAGEAVAVFSGSGGGGAVTTDLVAESGQPVAALNEATVRGLSHLMPASCAHIPFDLGAVPAPARQSSDWLAQVLQTMMADPGVGTGLYVMTTQPEMVGAALSVQAATRGSGKPLMFVNAASSCGHEALAALLADGGMAFDSVAQALAYHRSRVQHQRLLQSVSQPASQAAPPAPDFSAVLAQAATTPPGLLSEWQTKQWLAAAGLQIPAGEWVQQAEDAVRAAQHIGYPVVMKLVSEQISHKSDVGGVLLNLRSDDEVRTGFERLRAAAASVPGARFDGGLVQEMVRADVEFMAGVHRDPQFGPMLMFGFGGTLVELQRDTALLPASASPAEILRAVQGLKMLPLLQGYRGRPVVDLQALAGAIWRLGQLAIALGEGLEECEANPLMLAGDRIIAADARAVWKGKP